MLLRVRTKAQALLRALAARGAHLEGRRGKLPLAILGAPQPPRPPCKPSRRARLQRPAHLDRPRHPCRDELADRRAARNADGDPRPRARRALPLGARADDGRPQRRRARPPTRTPPQRPTTRPASSARASHTPATHSKPTSPSASDPANQPTCHYATAPGSNSRPDLSVTRQHMPNPPPEWVPS